MIPSKHSIPQDLHSPCLNLTNHARTMFTPTMFSRGRGSAGTPCAGPSPLAPGAEGDMSDRQSPYLHSYFLSMATFTYLEIYVLVSPYYFSEWLDYIWPRATLRGAATPHSFSCPARGYDIYIYIYTSIYLFIYLSLYLYLHLYISLSIYIYIYICRARNRV